MTSPRALRADTERTLATILEAAEVVLRRDPTATMKQIAEAAGVARTTVHRRFTTRDALIEALTVWATQRLASAVNSANPDSAPPLVALYQATANVLSAKVTWEFAMSHSSFANQEVVRIVRATENTCERLLQRAKEAGVLRDDVDVTWTRRVYFALVREAVEYNSGMSVDAMATQVVETLLHGAGTTHSDRL